ncbi:unnamed protein product [Lasius platythorax]|uniref:Uncharacterized protein n=1 Tax=Lasius platythorax TaxID=488582 RepID=A0AAV2P4R3_9HYME
MLDALEVSSTLCGADYEAFLLTQIVHDVLAGRGEASVNLRCTKFRKYAVWPVDHTRITKKRNALLIAPSSSRAGQTAATHFTRRTSNMEAPVLDRISSRPMRYGALKRARAL